MLFSLDELGWLGIMRTAAESGDYGPDAPEEVVERLCERGYAVPDGFGGWTITDAGMRELSKREEIVQEMQERLLQLAELDRLRRRSQFTD